MIHVDTKKLKLAIKKKGLKARWVAEKTGIKPNFLSMIIMGIRNPSKDTFRNLAKTLEMRQRDLLK